MGFTGADFVDFLNNVWFDLQHWQDANILTLGFRLLLLYVFGYIIFQIWCDIWRTLKKIGYWFKINIFFPLWRFFTLYRFRQFLHAWHNRRRGAKRRAKHEKDQEEKRIAEEVEIARQIQAINAKEKNY